MKLNWLLLLVIYLGGLNIDFLQLSAQSNEGTEFWFGFMEHKDVNLNTKVVMITSKYTTSGIISVPHHDWETTFTVNANDVTLVNLPSITEVIGSEQITDRGILLTSALPVSVYTHQFYNFRSEATVVLPTGSIGSEYYTMCYRGVVQGGIDYPSEFLIVATEDETLLDITVSDYTVGNKPPGTTFQVELNKGETYQVQGQSGPNDLTGSHISGDKNFAVFAGNRWTTVPTGCNARDNLLEQMFPVSTWGRQFVTAPNKNMNYSLYRILAAEDNTSIDVHNGSTQSYSINAGEFIEFNQSGASYIQSDKPIQVGQYLIGSNCNGHQWGDPSMVLLNSIEQTRDTVTLYSSTFQNISQNFINIIMASADAPFVTIDGEVVEDNYPVETIGLNDEFAYVQIPVGSGAHTIISEGCGVIATAYGYGEVESYAYSGGASFKAININPIPDGGCLNDTIFFDSGLPEPRYSFFWDLGDGNTSTQGAFPHFYPDLGVYPVTLIVEDNCLGTIDTMYKDLHITLRQAVDVVEDILICEGESFTLGATDIDGAIYEWNGPNGYFSEEQFPVIDNGLPEMSGDYAVIGIVSGCATFPAYAGIEVIATPDPELGPDTIFCNKLTSFILEPGIFSSYLWQDGSSGSTLSIEEDGFYSIEVSNQYGCIGRDSVVLTEVCPTKIYVPNAFSPNGDGINDIFEVYGTDIISLKLSIFDRWGNLLFISTDSKPQWNGKFNGELMNTGTYIWQLEMEGYKRNGTIYSQVLSGEVYLLY